MDFEKLLAGKTYHEFIAIADVWHGRLNKIKEAHAIPVPSGFDGYELAKYTSEKAERIANALIARLQPMFTINIQHARKETEPKWEDGAIKFTVKMYPVGSDIVGESGEEQIFPAQ